MVSCTLLSLCCELPDSRVVILTLHAQDLAAPALSIIILAPLILRNIWSVSSVAKG